MKSIPRSIIDLFDSKKRYVIPLFQRQYVWHQEKHWSPLWDDIKSKVVTRLNGRQTTSHFLGAMVLDQLRTYGNEVPAHIIIDGQQRLTTFQVFLAAFRDVANSYGVDRFAEEADTYIFNKGVMHDPDVEQFKVWPSKTDQPPFRSVMLLRDREKVVAAHPRQRIRRTWLPYPRLVEAYLYFYDTLRAFLIAPEYSQPVEQRIEAIYQAIRNDVQVVTIELDGADDPQVIFETLNARGEPLLPSDLLRNYVFFRAAQNKENQDALYSSYWEQLEQPFWRCEEKQGRLKRARIDLFVQHFLSMKTCAEVNVGRMFQEYKAWIVAEKPFENVEEELAELVHYSTYFRGLIQPEGESTVAGFSRRMNVIDVRTIYPLAMLIIGSKHIEQAEKDAMLRDLESYIIRRSVCQLTTKNYNKVFIGVLGDLKKSGLSSKALRTALLKLEGDTVKWPDDGEFLNAWLNQSVYKTLGPAKVESILTAIEQRLHTAKSEDVVIRSALTVEHVLPQNWFEHWPLPNGAKGKPWIERYTERHQGVNVEAHDQADERDRLLHTFGNLTLLTSSLNPSIGNGPYSAKRAEITKQSALALNRYFSEVGQWDEKAITERAKRLFDVAREVWPHPGKP